MPAFDITKEYFLKEYHLFRAFMCRSDKTVDDKLEAYKALWFVYLNLKTDMLEDDYETCQFAMGALDLELNMRIGLQFRMEVEALVKAEFKAMELQNG